MILKILSEVIEEDSYRLFNDLTNAIPIEYKNISDILDKYNYNDIYISSDLHFMKDSNTIDNLKIKMHNSVINNKDDVVYINLGDMGYKKNIDDEENFKDKVKLLNKGTYNILINGNHDLYDDNTYIECGFNIVCRTGFIYKNIIFSHIPILDSNINTNYINIHGHLHDDNMDTLSSYFPNNLYSRCNRIKVYTKLNNYKPITLQKLLSDYNNRIGG